MINIYAATGVTNSKVCHHRTAALQHGGFESLGPHQINTLTKHKIEKQSSAYGPVAERKTLQIMAGFINGEPYHLERGQVVLPHNIGMYEHMLLGDKVADWRNEADMDDVGKSLCCFHFLHGLIPWFVEVLVQDGVFFIFDYPSHPLSNWLKNSIPNYETWAHATRRLVLAKTQAFDLDRVSALNAASLNALNTLHGRLDHAEEENKTLKATLARQDVKMQQMLLDVLQALQANNQQQQQQHEPQHEHQGQEQQQEQQQQQQQQPAPPPPPPPPPQQQQRTAPRLQRNVTVALQSTPRLPTLQKGMPKTMALLQAAWRANNLDTFLSNEQREWPHSLVIRYEKHLYLMRHIQSEMAPNVHSTEEESAAAADLLIAQFGFKTVNKFLKHLKTNDRSVVGRTYRGRNRPNAIEHPPNALAIAFGVQQQPPPPPGAPPPPPPPAPPPPPRRNDRSVVGRTYRGRNRPNAIQYPPNAFAIAFGVQQQPPPPPGAPLPLPPAPPPPPRFYVIRGDADPPPWERYHHRNTNRFDWQQWNVQQIGFPGGTTITSGQRLHDIDVAD
jgi:hypothetical protein